MEFRTHEQLMEAIEADVMGILEEATEMMLTEVQDTISEVVYEPWVDEVSLYPRRETEGDGEGTFLGSWVKTSVSYNDAGNLFTSIFSYDAFMDTGLVDLVDNPHEMDLGTPIPAVHKSPNMEEGQELELGVDSDIRFNPEDRRPHMDEIIAEGTDWDFYFDSQRRPGWWTQPRDFWNPILDNTQDILSIISKAYLDRNGIRYKKMK